METSSRNVDRSTLDFILHYASHPRIGYYCFDPLMQPSFFFHTASFNTAYICCCHHFSFHYSGYYCFSFLDAHISLLSSWSVIYSRFGNHFFFGTTSEMCIAFLVTTTFLLLDHCLDTLFLKGSIYLSYLSPPTPTPTFTFQISFLRSSPTPPSFSTLHPYILLFT